MKGKWEKNVGKSGKLRECKEKVRKVRNGAGAPGNLAEIGVPSHEIERKLYETEALEEIYALGAVKCPPKGLKSMKFFEKHVL